jgi:hypothetical protein
MSRVELLRGREEGVRNITATYLAEFIIEFVNVEGKCGSRLSFRTRELSRLLRTAI